MSPKDFRLAPQELPMKYLFIVISDRISQKKKNIRVVRSATFAMYFSWAPTVLCGNFCEVNFDVCYLQNSLTDQFLGQKALSVEVIVGSGGLAFILNSIHIARNFSWVQFSRIVDLVFTFADTRTHSHYDYNFAGFMFAIRRSFSNPRNFYPSISRYTVESNYNSCHTHFLNIARSEINISFDSFLSAMCENYVWSESVNYLYSDYKIFFTFWTTKIWIYTVWWPRVSLLSLRFRHFPVPKLFYGSKREIPKSVPGCEIQSIGRVKARPRQVMSSIEMYVAIKLSVTRTSFRPVLAF